jgi:small neutral amino acid transporter SnatA (MarC family)
MDWLVDNFELFGVTIENWMLVIGGGLLLYIAMLMIARRRQAPTH